MENYETESIAVAKDIMDYICKNLGTYGYNAVDSYLSKYGRTYTMKK